MQVVVIGGGVAGTFCAGQIAEFGHSCILIERNEKIGKKLYLTGKGRCNLTNDTDVPGILSQVLHGDKFLLSALHRWGAADTMEFARQNGCPVKVERGNRVFPQSDKSSDVIRLLERYARDNGAEIRLNTRVSGIEIADGRVCAVIADGRRIACDRVVVATGGRSYSSTGSTGDGYAFARQCGHTVVAPRPALVPMYADGYATLAGLTLKNVRATLTHDGREIASQFGELLFTHTGVSGPVVLSLSGYANRYWQDGALQGNTELLLDLKTALDEQTLDARMQRTFAQCANMRLRNAVSDYLPKALVAFWLDRAGVAQDRFCHSVTKSERERLVRTLKRFSISVRALGDIECGIITAGGVELSQVQPKTMESKLVSGLYFAGEVLDIDALTGGYNIQIALSTAYAAACAIKNS